MQLSAKILICCLVAVFFLLPQDALAQRKKRRPAVRRNKPLAELLHDSPVFDKGLTGFVLFDPATGNTLQERNSDKYFTPASNTKIFTLFTALQILGDSLPVWRYVDIGDTIVFWGAGNPAFLHADLPTSAGLLEWFSTRPEALCFTDFNFRDDHFGPGWSWADYTEAYQPERAPMPIYGNVVQFRFLGADSGFVAAPPFFRDSLVYNPQLEEENRAVIQRVERSNRFEYNSAALRRAGFRETVPFDYSPALFVRLLADTLKRSVGLFDAAMLPAGPVNTVYVPATDSLLMRLMHQSDNLVAEQLMLMCSEVLFSTQNVRKVIDYMKEYHLRGIPDRLEWWDGSGLSRYNFFTPRSVVYVLHQLYKKVPEDRLFNLFPAGGVSGTIRDWYGPAKGRQPYVFAKTGTLRYVHCLSGYIKAKSGKTLIFSFMHNNFTGSADVYKAQMQAVLRKIYEQY